MINNTLVTCEILNFNDYKTVEKLVDTIKNYDSLDYIVVVDNFSTDNSFSELTNRYKRNEKVKVISSLKNGGYGYGNNFGIKYARSKLNSKYVILANPDVFFSNQTVKELVTVMQKKRATIVSAVQKVNHKAIEDRAWKIPSALEWTLGNIKTFSKLRTKYHYSEEYFSKSDVVQVDCVPGAMFLLDVEKFLSVGGFDEKVFLFGEETILGFKLRQREYKTFLCNKLFYDHEHSVSINKSIPSKVRQYKMIDKSKRYFIKEYIKPNKFVLAISELALRRFEKKISQNIK